MYQLINRCIICFQPFIQFFTLFNSEKNQSHPNICHNNIHSNHSPIQRFLVFVDFEHSCLIGTTTDPTSCQRRQPSPGSFITFSTNSLRTKNREQPDSSYST